MIYHKYMIDCLKATSETDWQLPQLESWSDHCYHTLQMRGDIMHVLRNTLLDGPRFFYKRTPKGSRLIRRKEAASKARAKNNNRRTLR